MSSYEGLCPDCQQVECDEACMKATSNVKLLPEPAFVGMSIPYYTADQVRACVAHATAAKDAEIEALRAEVAEARDGWHMANGTADLAMKHRDVAESRAERLTEALREIEALSPLVGVSAARTIARAALHPTAAQEKGRE